MREYWKWERYFVNSEFVASKMPDCLPSEHKKTKEEVKDHKSIWALDEQAIEKGNQSTYSRQIKHVEDDI